MAEIAVSFTLERLSSLLTEEVNLLGGIHKEFADMKDELESIQAFLKDADRRAAAEGDMSEGIKTWVKQVREAASRIEDVIDEYMICVGQQPRHPGCAASLCKTVHWIRTLKPRHQIASVIQDIKSSLHGMKERSETYRFQIQPSFEQGSRGSGGSQNDRRMASLFIGEAEVVGFEASRDELIGWLVDGAVERTVISVVGMGGLGKTTLAKKVFDNQKVIGHFDCHAWITVSQSYNVEGLLRQMLEQFCRERREAPPQGIYEMDRQALIHQVRNYLQQKRYVVLFDDVWNEKFWDEIEFAVFDNKNGSRVLITTRSMHVAEFCKKSSFVHVHELQPLSPEKSWELFCKKAFRFELDGYCPEELTDISLEIVQKCEGLPLAIVAVGGLLCTKEKNEFEWKKLSQNLSSELEENPHLVGITRILALSYDDLPYYLKSCFLHFGIYPEDYSVPCERLIWQWIAEGFVKNVKGKILEAVAEQYLTQMIRRSLVQVSQYNVDGKPVSCRVHNLLREMIIRKMEDSSFCHFVSDDGHSIFGENIRRLAIANSSNDLMGTTESSHIRSLNIFGDNEITKSFMRRVPTQCRLLKVLDFEGAPLGYIPKSLGNLFHLRYLNFNYTNLQSLPKSIGKLQNLETLILIQTHVCKMPRQINKLRKLRHIVAYHLNYEVQFNMSWDWETGFQMNGNFGSLTSLQTLTTVKVDHGGVKLITELGKMRQLRELGLVHVRREYGSALCVSINEMHHLENLDISAIAEDEVIDLHSISSPQLRCLYLKGKLEKLPDWLQKLRCLVELSLLYSKLTDDPLKFLKNMPNLLILRICDAAYEGESLHFQEGGFQKLKKLGLRNLHSLNSILIDRGALPSLKEFEFGGIPQLKELPFGIQHLQKLEVLDIYDMPHEFNQSIDPHGGQDHWIIEHVPIVYISHMIGPRYWDYDTRIIRHSS